MTHPRRTRCLAYLAALATGAGLLTAAAPAEAKAAHDTTSRVERQRVDTVPTPRLDWYDCLGAVQCATAKLPVDYDRPRGATTEIALLRDPADDPKHKIGTLFVNPGGPGGLGTLLAFVARGILSPEVLDRFDIVGFDPRGTNNSDNVQCFANEREQVRALTGFDSFPTTRKAEAGTMKAAAAFGRGCASTGKPLAASMSTAQVARDLDVLRRAVGDDKLSYLGFSYGTYLGQVYANLYPDRVRALALDGVVDPLAWRGSAATRDVPVWDRLRSADGAGRALREILVRCDRRPDTCPFAAGDPVANFDLIAARLQKKPLPTEDLFGDPVSYGYAEFVSEVTGQLYAEGGADTIAAMLADLLVATEPPARGPAVAATSSGARAAALRDLSALRRTSAKATDIRRPDAGFPYDNQLDAFAAVSCTDSVNPGRLRDYPTYAAAADRRVAYFGALFVWNGQTCARDVWRARDEDSYRGRFTRRTVNPVLFVGNTYDPVTNYRSAVAAARLAPNSALLSSNSWGHTAYGTSACATGAVDRYLLTGTTPAAGRTCTGDYQPFAVGAADQGGTTVQRLAVQSVRRLQAVSR